ncbi:hypothetical protein O181_040924 [Austropuccinia psidii MF-1]|uniref:Integrase catalytic domain-containing protein n=1 Tax=Austropuccinia psidii MF-1 TaxID=1389203 RepID=A0A9Q3DDF3_9BASI|nr:hypothetical protein [Austropuccinia psidii MF-1]
MHTAWYINTACQYLYRLDSPIILAVNSVALVGELKTPSLPSSVHTPSIIPSQSLLPLRDEVFKEIKDVGEDVAISSLHLFQGDMDLPPLSFHASLEEQWDEEEEPEEIETVLKVVPPAYHQYLDVFSKVKAEKLPPHHACDHHIKLEGLLPPIGVIYSLSNPESDTLWAYISENIEKGFIRPSSSSTGEPVLFIKKKDGGLHFCVDYRKLNVVTRKNRYPFPPMNQLLTVFNGSTIFCKIDLRALSQFSLLKEALTTAPILSHFNPSLPTIVETDASDYALGAVLSQVNDSGKHPIGFHSRKLLPAELNYEIHDKERLGIVWALKRWRAFLLSLFNSFEVLTDHSSLQYFMSSKVLTHRQPHWAEFLPEFHFTITYRPGRLATLPDALSHGIQESIFFSIKVDIFSDLVDKIQKQVWRDKDYKERQKQLARGESVRDYSLEPQSKLILFKDRVVSPRNEELQLNILQKCHNPPLAGYPGQEKTFKLIKRDSYWAGMNQFIKDYVSSCQQCSRNKNIDHKKFGLLKPFQIPSGPWNSLSMDFINQLPLSNNFDSILVVVDRFSKMAIFIPTYGTITALDLAQIFISHVFSKHGLPVSIVSDRGSLFVSLFWTQLCQQLKISRDLSTAFQPETDGQTERVNKILQQYLWMYVIYHQDDWYTWLPLAEFAYNNSKHSSTKQSPFFTIYGRNPGFDSIHISQASPAGKLSTTLQSVQQVVKEEFESAIRRFKNYADRNRAIPPHFQPGDKVWLAYKNIKITRPTKIFLERWLVPFDVLKKIGSHAYHLNFPQQWKSAHPVFHVSLLEPVKQSTIPN